MKTWYTCKVKYAKIDENGKQTNVTEPYLVDAVSFTEAEARIYDRISELVDGEFFVTTISKTNIHEILQFDSCDYFYLVKFKYVSADEESGKEKKVTNNYLVAATGVDDAFNKTKDDLKTMLVPYDITSIVLSPIVDIFPFESEDEELNQEIPENLTPIAEYQATKQEDSADDYDDESEEEVDEDDEENFSYKKVAEFEAPDDED